MALPRLSKPIGRPQPSNIKSALNAWFESDLGQLSLGKEKEILDDVLPQLFGYHLVYTGLQNAASLVESSPIKNKVFLDGHVAGSKISANASQLPISNNSTDLVLLHHSLDFEKDPFQVIREATRAIIPNGHIIVVGFNPWSLWGLWRAAYFRSSKSPWTSRFISPYRLSDWLGLLDFDVIGCESGFYMPPYFSLGNQESLNWIDRTGSAWLTQRGGLYVLVAKKKMSCITPVHLESKVRKRKLIPVPAAGQVVSHQKQSTRPKK